MQGNVAILYCLQSSITINAHTKLFPDRVFPSPDGQIAKRKRSDGYVDDLNYRRCDTMVGIRNQSVI